jgi:acetoin utilization deacetylase AcuC-like enzyme
MTTVYVTHPRYIEHEMPGHPEHPGRIQAIWQELDASGLAARMKCVAPDMVDDEQILAVHTPQYLDILKEISQRTSGVLFDSDTYAFPESPDIARLSAGGVVRAVDEVLSGEADNGLAVVRPPGHHALPQRGMGFCLLGNIAIAAHHALNVHGLDRVLIVDYDVHHGNGTQDMFYDDNRVLYISTHQSPYYPGSGSIEEIGTGSGRGFTVNIPLPAGCGDQNYARVYEEIVWPVAGRFDPQLILVSAGFDVHWVDPLASMALSLAGYAHLNRQLMQMAEQLCGGRIVFVTEGGYDLDALAHGVRNIAHALLRDDEFSDPLGTKTAREPNIDSLIQRLRDTHNIGEASDGR